MIWQVSDEGRIEVRLRAEGEQAIKVARAHADRYIGNIVGDLSATLGVDVVTTELRYSFSKTRPEVTVVWRARTPVGSVPDVREYFVRLSASEQPVQGEVGDVHDEPPDQ
jgi:hypothetical protein